VVGVWRPEGKAEEGDALVLGEYLASGSAHRVSATTGMARLPSRMRSPEGCLSRHRLTKDKGVHLDSALVGEDRLQVVGVPHHRVLE